jgi:hypothetical protein
MRGYIILCCAVCAGPTCDASNVSPDEGIIADGGIIILFYNQGIIG